MLSKLFRLLHIVPISELPWDQVHTLGLLDPKIYQYCLSFPYFIVPRAKDEAVVVLHHQQRSHCSPHISTNDILQTQNCIARIKKLDQNGYKIYHWLRYEDYIRIFDNVVELELHHLCQRDNKVWEVKTTLIYFWIQKPSNVQLVPRQFEKRYNVEESKRSTQHSL